MQLRETMETPSAGSGRKKLKHRLAAILSAFSRRGGRKRRESEEEASPPLAFPSYSLLGVGVGVGKKPGGGGGPLEPRRFSVSAPKAPPMVHIGIDCAGRRSVDAADPSLLPLSPFDAAAGRKAERRLTETGLPYETTGEWEGRKCPPSSPFVAHLPPLPPVARWREQRADNGSSSRRLSSSRRMMAMASSSSSEDEYDEDARNLFSSRSFSSDSSDFYNCPPSRKHTTTTATTRARASVSGPCRAPPARRGASQSCRYSFELPRGSAASADGGFAVVKRSDDPYEDFRNSMREMIAEWDGAGADRLLETYLVLNSPRHYPAILAAFADVRETLFP